MINAPIRLIFIVGVGRSGTSLLQSMLASHPGISYLPETAFLRRYVATGVLQRVLRCKGKSAAAKHLADDKEFRRTKLDAGSLVYDASKSEGQLDALVYQRMLYEVRDNATNYTLDKDPRGIEFLPVLAALYPQAQVIHVIRDPRDVIASKKRADWSKSGHIWRHVFASRIQLALGRSQGRAHFGQSYHELVYEELISDADQVLRTLCRSMGIPFSDKMLNFADAARNLVSESELSWKKETFGPLLDDNFGKWRTHLSLREARLVEVCCEEAMGVGEYLVGTNNHKIRFLDGIWIGLGNLVITLTSRPYIFFRKFVQKRSCRRLM